MKQVSNYFTSFFKDKSKKSAI